MDIFSLAFKDLDFYGFVSVVGDGAAITSDGCLLATGIAVAIFSAAAVSIATIISRTFITTSTAVCFAVGIGNTNIGY